MKSSRLVSLFIAIFACMGVGLTAFASPVTADSVTKQIANSDLASNASTDIATVSTAANDTAGAPADDMFTEKSATAEKSVILAFKTDVVLEKEPGQFNLLVFSKNMAPDEAITEINKLSKCTYSPSTKEQAEKFLKHLENDKSFGGFPSDAKSVILTRPTDETQAKAEDSAKVASIPAKQPGS